MQAVILAAGMGSRLGERTKDTPKCLVEVNGVSLINRLLTQLTRFHLSRVVIVVGYKHERLIDHVDLSFKDKLNIEYILNPIYNKTNNIYSLLLAARELGEDDTLLIESDLVFDFEILEQLFNHPAKDVAMVSKYEDFMNGTVVCMDDDLNITDFIPKQEFKSENSDSYYKTVNAYKLSREFLQNKYIPFLETYVSVVGKNDYYEQVLRLLTLSRISPLKALSVTKSKWYEIDTPQIWRGRRWFFRKIRPRKLLLSFMLQTSFG